jgi:hypothetical protein
MQPARERLLIRAITAGAGRIREQRLKIADFVRMCELRNLVALAGPRMVLAYWVTA